MPVNDCVVHPGGALASFGSPDEIRVSPGASGSPGLNNIIEAHSAPGLPGDTAPRRGIATKDRNGVVEPIPDFRRQADGP